MTPQYYWLCRNCSAEMTLHVSPEGKVMPLALQRQFGDFSRESDFISPERREGLLLSSTNCSSETHRRRARFVG